MFLCFINKFYCFKVGFTGSTANIRDLFASKDLGVFKDSFKGLVNPSGVLMLRMTANWNIVS